MRTRHQAIDSCPAQQRRKRLASEIGAILRPVPHHFLPDVFSELSRIANPFRQPKPNTWGTYSPMRTNSHSISCDWSSPIAFSVTPQTGVENVIHRECKVVHRVIYLDRTAAPRVAYFNRIHPVGQTDADKGFARRYIRNESQNPEEVSRISAEFSFGENPPQASHPWRNRQ